MMRKQTSSEILQAFLAGRVLLFLFLFFSTLFLSNNESYIISNDKNIADSSAKEKIYISEGTIIYNQQLIFINDNTNTNITLAKSKRKKVSVTTKSTLRKSKTGSANFKKNKVHIATESYKKVPSDGSSFFENCNISRIVVLPTNHNIKMIVDTTNSHFYILNRFRYLNSFYFTFNALRESHHWQNNTRPPPFV